MIDLLTLALAKKHLENYVDEKLILGDRDHYDPDMPITNPNWESGVTYHQNGMVNHHYRGFKARSENTNSAPYEGSPAWSLEPDDYVVDGSVVEGVVMSGNYAAYGAGTGASAGRGFIVVDGYGLYCTENTILTQANIDAIFAFVDALPFPVPSWPVTGSGIPGAEVWRIMYGWPGKGRFQVSFFPGGVMRWVDPRVQLGLKTILDPQGGDPVTAKGIADWVRQTTYPIGSLYVSVNNTNPAISLGFGTWAAFGAGRTLVGVNTADSDFNAANKTGGAKTHTLTEAQMPRHSHEIRRDSATNPGYLPTGGTPGSVIAGSGAQPSQNGGFQDRAGSDYNNTPGLISNKGDGLAHNNMPPYVTVFMFVRTA